MNKRIEEFKRYLENHTFDSGDSDCKTVLDQLYRAYAEYHEDDPAGISTSRAGGYFSILFYQYPPVGVVLKIQQDYNSGNVRRATLWKR